MNLTIGDTKLIMSEVAKCGLLTTGDLNENQ